MLSLLFRTPAGTWKGINKAGNRIRDYQPSRSRKIDKGRGNISLLSVNPR
jgi:hypothetical protein